MRILTSGEPCLEFEEMDSTSEEARRRAELGERGPLWIRADRQRTGRGRRGRRWISEPGNLYTTHLGPALRTPAERPQLSLVAAVAVADALVGLVGSKVEQGLRVKWPNDVLAGGRKLAGLLLDGDADWVATGIGVNLIQAPEGLDRPVTSLSAAFRVTLSPADTLDAIAAAYARWRSLWAEEGLDPIRTAWLAYGPPLGEPMSVQADAEAGGPGVSGRFRGLDADGALLLEEQGGGIRRIAAGEIVPAGEEA